MNDDLLQFIERHVERGACRCGQCIDRVPGSPQPPGPHTVNVGFFDVSVRESPDPATLRRLLEEHPGAFNLCDPLDGQPHDFAELGAWVGDQALALMLIGLGTLLGLWGTMAVGEHVFLIPLQTSHGTSQNETR